MVKAEPEDSGSVLRFGEFAPSLLDAIFQIVRTEPRPLNRREMNTEMDLIANGLVPGFSWSHVLVFDPRVTLSFVLRYGFSATVRQPMRPGFRVHRQGHPLAAITLKQDRSQSARRISSLSLGVALR